MLVDLDMPQSEYADRRRRAQFLDEVMAQLQSVSSIAAATPVECVAPSPDKGGISLNSPPKDSASSRSRPMSPSTSSPSTPTTSTRSTCRWCTDGLFTVADREGSQDVAIVSEDIAARIWRGKNPIGKRLKMGRPL
jgi:hypothetical protein